MDRIFNLKDFNKRDSYGLLSMNILGDSISHGANAENMYLDSWTSLLRKKFMEDLDTLNYGFINFLSPLFNEKGIYKDILTFKNDGWELVESRETIGFFEIKSSEVKTSYNGIFQEAIQLKEIILKANNTHNSGQIKIELLDENNEFIKEEIIKLGEEIKESLISINVYTNKKIKEIKIINILGKNILSGIFIMFDKDKPVLNNYSRSGARIHDLEGDIIEKAFNTNTLIFSLGHNKCEDDDEYLKKCVEAFNKYKPRLIVLDFCWNEDNENTSIKLKDLASKCNSKYIDCRSFKKYSWFLSDESHPTKEGHRFLFEKIVEEL